MAYEISKKSGVSYLFQGLQLVSQPGLRRFVLLPLLTNLLLFSAAFYWLFSQLSELADHWIGLLPEWLTWLEYLLWPLAIITVLLLFSFIFSMVANWIAAPFNGLLAEQVEARLTGVQPPEVSVTQLLKDVPRILAREWQKLKYYLPKAIGCLILFFIPLVGQTIAPVLWLLLCAWMAAIQYCDYPYDNHKIRFEIMREDLKNHRWTNLGFGLIVSVCTAIPIINFLIMPIAICGATAMWVDLYREKYRGTD
ncbi:MAG: sulfate transporter CysZ [Aeromonadaceae bacterium]|nr:sulfate transporter CysZ [Aeromonadaceae bacterium]